MNEREAEHLIDRTMSRLMSKREGPRMSTREVLTRDAGPTRNLGGGGGPGIVESNLEVAVRQGRIRESERAKWRAEYERRPYESVTADLLSRRATARVAPETADERAIRNYLIQTRAI